MPDRSLQRIVNRRRTRAQGEGAVKWRLDLNSATLYLTVGSRNCPSSSSGTNPVFELPQMSFADRASCSGQMRNSSPQLNTTSCFEFKSGQPDTVRTFLSRYCRAANIATSCVQSCCGGISVICLQNQHGQLARSASRIGRNTDVCSIGWRSYLGRPPLGAIPKHLPWAGSSCEDS